MDIREDWLRMAKSGENPQAYQLWVKRNCTAIACIAFQTGVHEEIIGDFQSKVFNRFYLELPSLNLVNAEKELYRVAVETLLDFIEPDNVHSPDAMFLFKEDAALHKAIQNLELKNRIAFTFFHFHGKSLEELTDILMVPKLELKLKLGLSKRSLMEYLSLEERELEKRLEFLAKSYSRMTFPLPRKLDSFKETFLPVLHENAWEARSVRSGKKGATVLIVVCLFLGTVIISTFNMEDLKSKGPVETDDSAELINDKALEWRAQYESVKNRSPGLLGVAPETYEEFSFVIEADHMITRILGDDNLEKMKDNPQALEDQFTRALFHIQTPKGMVELLEGNSVYPMGMDEFVYEFANKTAELMEVADQLLQEHETEFSDAVNGGQRSSEKLASNADKYSANPKNLLNGLDEQMLMIISHPNEERFITKRKLTRMHNIPHLMNDRTIASNLAMMENEPFFDETGLLISLEKAAYLLKELEQYLLNDQSRSMLYTEFLAKFGQLFWLVLKGSENKPVFTEAGTVQEEYKAVWNTLCESRKNPMLSVMLPIIEEMEETGWTDSKHYNRLLQTSIVQAINMERAGLLVEEMPHGHIAAGTQFIDMADFSYDNYTDLYNQFKVAYDQSLLVGKSPLEVYFLYHYANGMEDPETMWHLLVEDERKPDLQEFTNEWQQLPDISKTARWIEVSGESFYWSSKTLHVNININYYTDHPVFQRGPVLVTTGNDIWLIKYFFSESYQNIQQNGAFKERIISIYNNEESESATPIEVFGMILLAIEQADYKKLEGLTTGYYQEDPNADFQDFAAFHEFPHFRDLVNLSFVSEEVEQKQWRDQGRVYMNTATESFSKVFPMVKTEQGWKLSY
ncbi:MAG TPA: hypothetical protein VK947_09465 [Planococcus sp. (in: firmicutes)]|nr:hypothetical protein [Planococcus sp. (in: firmicutes)]